MATRPRPESHTNNNPSGSTSARIDVWLWSVRQVRSRSAATSACKAGHVRINGETAKPAQHVSVGDEVRYRVDGFDRLLTVTQILTKRVGAPIARTSTPPLLVPPLWTHQRPSSGNGERDGPRRRRDVSSTPSWDGAAAWMTDNEGGERPHRRQISEGTAP